MHECVVRVGVLFAPPVGCREVYLPANKHWSYLRKNVHVWSDREECQEFQLLVVQWLLSQLVDEDDGDEGVWFPRADFFEPHPHRCRPHSGILQFLRSVVLFFVLLAGFEEWFNISAGSLPCTRRVISCILFALEQSRVVDLSVAGDHPDSISESNVLSDEFAQLLSQFIYDFPIQFCQIT